MAKKRETRTWSILALVLLAAALTGCIGDDDVQTHQASPDDPEATQAATTPQKATSNQTHLLSYDPDETPTTWTNDSFSHHDACLPAGCATGNAAHTTDITPTVSSKAPTNVTVSIDYNTAPGWSVMGAWFETEDAQIHSSQLNAEPGHVTLEGLITRASQGTVQVTIHYSLPPQPTEDTQTEYTMKAQGEPNPHLLPWGHPVELDLEPGQNLTANAIDGDEITLRVFNPDDEAIHTITTDEANTRWQIPHDQDPGAYVITNIGDSSITLESPTETTLRGLLLDVEASDPETYDATDDEVEWSFDAPQDPLWVAVYIQTENDPDDPFFGGDPGVTAGGFDAQVTIPNEDTREASWQCGICISGGFQTALGPTFGDSDLTQGTYHAHLSTEASIGYQYGHLILTYNR